MDRTGYVAVTPGFDLYIDELAASSPDFAGFRARPLDDSLPPGVRQDQVCDMPALTNAQRSQLFAEAELIAQAERVEPGFPAPGVGAGG
eukprot:2381266-Alexandrium_andersonii.AAC.1